MSGSLPFDSSIKDTGNSTGGSRGNDTASGLAFLAATEPLVQDFLHLGIGGEDGDLRITWPELEVRGGHVVCITSPVAILAMKPIPLAVLRRDEATASKRFRTGLTGVGRIDRLRIGATDARMHSYTTSVLGSHPGGADPGELPGLGLATQVRQVLDNQGVGTLPWGLWNGSTCPRAIAFSVDDLFHRLARERAHARLSPLPSGSLLLRSEVVSGDVKGTPGARIDLPERMELASGLAGLVVLLGEIL